MVSTSGGLVPDPHVIVVFGADGDLARRRLLPALFHLFSEGLLPEGTRIIGSSLSALDDGAFRDVARDAVDRFARCEPGEQWPLFASKLSFVAGEFGPAHAAALKAAVADARRVLGGGCAALYYLAVPPTAFAPITRGLDAAGLVAGAKIVYEKPFGADHASFVELDAVVSAALRTEQVFRIDHFLGKETVQNLLALRFGNGMFEPVWNNRHISQVQIDVPETLGIGTRAGFYDRTGAFRDMIVTHLLQVLSFVAMSPPATMEALDLIDAKVAVFESIRPLQPGDVVFGRYDGYADVEGVAPDSRTETFAAARLWIDDDRWEGVPFYLRTGKRMAESRQTITLAFRPSPTNLLPQVPVHGMDEDHITFDLGSDEAMTVNFRAKRPGYDLVLAPAEMSFRYSSSFGSELIGAYERLIHDALVGDRTLFTRPDGIERTWEIVAPVLADPPPLHPYPQGSWGPAAAGDLIAPHTWHLPEDGNMHASGR